MGIGRLGWEVSVWVLAFGWRVVRDYYAFDVFPCQQILVTLFCAAIVTV